MKGRWLALAILTILSVGVAWRLMIAAAPGGARVTSWWRSSTKNREVGGVWNSRHLAGLAWDVQPRNEQMRGWLENLGLKVLPTDSYPNHLHAEWTLATPFLLVVRLWR